MNAILENTAAQIFGFWYFIPILILIAMTKTPWFKGVVGEFLVNFAANKMLNKDEYRLFKNVTLPTDDGSTQIDHVIVSKKGIFVVETKNMKGWIFGNEKQKQWTQKIFKHSSKFQNPLHQNYKHTKTLSELINVDNSKIFSIVVFTGSSTFKTKMPSNVTHGTGFIKFIKSKKVDLLSAEDVQGIINDIQSGRLKPSIKTNIQHVKHVKEIKKNKEAESQQLPIKNSTGKLSSSKFAKKINLKTNEFISLLEINGLLSKDGDKFVLTNKGIEQGGEEKKGRHGTYFAWPENINL